MKVMDFLVPRAVTANIKAQDKEGALKELVDLLEKAGAISEPPDGIVKILMAREGLGSTGIGSGVGIPHGKTNSVKKLIAAFGLSRNGVNFDSLDGEPVYIFFLLLAPENLAGPHLKALARISRLLKDKYFRDTLRNCKDDKEIVKVIRQEDQKRH